MQPHVAGQAEAMPPDCGECGVCGHRQVAGSVRTNAIAFEVGRQSVLLHLQPPSTRFKKACCTGIRRSYMWLVCSGYVRAIKNSRLTRTQHIDSNVSMSFMAGKLGLLLRCALAQEIDEDGACTLKRTPSYTSRKSPQQRSMLMDGDVTSQHTALPHLALACALSLTRCPRRLLTSSSSGADFPTNCVTGLRDGRNVHSRFSLALCKSTYALCGANSAGERVSGGGLLKTRV